ncbi:NUDIX hydrolase [Pseudomonas citronellolis]|uniref:NUDIX hydrolase n=1 Tax=Pseudomonas citronellolis TaxID=53408 RepID=UPI0023E47069|nr:NUDIX domain-containing protein [Pseudomonas citronellolis]MDF3933899.1 NUDIX domain-containing protein [Pseudomonas citronellolis]
MGSAIKERATVICRQDDKILFVRKARRKWNLPGGRIEADEVPRSAAQRELAEETGLLVEALDYLAPLELYQTLHYVFEADLPDPQRPQPLNEIADCRWFSLDELDKRNVNKAIRRLLKDCQRPPQ